MNAQSATKTVKPKFADVWKEAGLDFLKMAETIAELAKVELCVIENLMLEMPVTKVQAEKVLTTISHLTSLTYALDTLDIPLMNGDVSLIAAREQESYGQAHV